MYCKLRTTKTLTNRKHDYFVNSFCILASCHTFLLHTTALCLVHRVIVCVRTRIDICHSMYMHLHKSIHIYLNIYIRTGCIRYICIYTYMDTDVYQHIPNILYGHIHVSHCRIYIHLSHYISINSHMRASLRDYSRPKKNGLIL